MRNKARMLVAVIVLLTIAATSVFAGWTSSQTGSCDVDHMGYEGTFRPFLDWSCPTYGGSPGTIAGTWNTSPFSLTGWYRLTYTHTDTIGNEIQKVYQGSYGADRVEWFGNWTNGNPYCDCGVSGGGTMSGTWTEGSGTR